VQGHLTLALVVWFKGFVPRFGSYNRLLLFLALHSVFLGGMPWKKKPVFVAA
jgi:hypothetical protein